MVAAVTTPLAALLREARRPVFFTGAGISTESGLPDFRSPSGFWSNNKPIPFDEFVASATARRRSWLRNREIIARVNAIQPNPGHLAIAAWMAQRPAALLITQNVDGLHQRAGAPVERTIELHGNATYATCLDCGRRHDPAPFHRVAEEGGELPGCPHCAGLVKSATISFGQQMPVAALARASEAAAACDLMLVAGSSLVVHPAAALPEHAAAAGAPLVILNREPTPLDALAQIVIHDELGRIFEALAAACQ